MGTRKRREWLGPCSYTRNRIKSALIIDRLQAHVMGEVDMTPSQVAAAMGLLKKVLPDLQAIEHKGNVDSKAIVQVISYARQDGMLTLHNIGTGQLPGGQNLPTLERIEKGTGVVEETGGSEKLTSTPHLQFHQNNPGGANSAKPTPHLQSSENVIDAEYVTQPENSPDLPK